MNMRETNAIVVFVIIAVYSCAKAETNTYHNPVDGKAYTADWQDYKPRQMAPKDIFARVSLENVRLLAEQEMFNRNISVGDLSAFIKKTQTAIENSVSNRTQGCELLVQTTLKPGGKPTFEMSSQGDPSEEYLQAIYDGLQNLPDIRTKIDAVKFQAQFSIKSASGTGN